ncbi:hypothetical protein ACFV2H_14065 [Streptomyces sp. NPDC059629]|uniref:hypothetical protein n=1 Tax=Streptomyces sp. NPDC059629 TaxID=3346889 RepID=UPI0036943172
MAVAVVVGLVVGQVDVRLRGRLSDPVLNTAVSFVIPFVAFVPVEEFHASGVLAVVVTGHETPRILRAQDRLTEAANWRTPRPGWTETMRAPTSMTEPGTPGAAARGRA